MHMDDPRGDAHSWMEGPSYREHRYLDSKEAVGLVEDSMFVYIYIYIYMYT